MLHDHIQGIDPERRTRNIHTDSWSRRVAGHDICTLLVAVRRRRRVRCVDSLSGGRGDIVERRAGIDNVFESTASGRSDRVAVELQRIDVDGVEVGALGVAGDAGDDDGCCGEVLRECDVGHAAEGEVAGWAGDGALDDQGEVVVGDELGLEHAGEEGVVGGSGVVSFECACS